MCLSTNVEAIERNYARNDFICFEHGKQTLRKLLHNLEMGPHNIFLFHEILQYTYLCWVKRPTVNTRLRHSNLEERVSGLLVASSHSRVRLPQRASHDL